MSRPKTRAEYYAREDEFCKEELTKFYEHDNDAWRDKHRQAVLNKRKKFRYECN